MSRPLLSSPGRTACLRSGIPRKVPAPAHLCRRRLRRPRRPARSAPGARERPFCRVDGRPSPTPRRRHRTDRTSRRSRHSSPGGWAGCLHGGGRERAAPPAPRERRSSAGGARRGAGAGPHAPLWRPRGSIRIPIVVCFGELGLTDLHRRAAVEPQERELPLSLAQEEPQNLVVS